MPPAAVLRVASPDVRAVPTPDSMDTLPPRPVLPMPPEIAIAPPLVDPEPALTVMLPPC